VGEAAEEGGARVYLFDRHELVGLVGLGGASGTAEDGGDAGALEQTGFRRERRADAVVVTR
jgi:hypothetical protein